VDFRLAQLFLFFYFIRPQDWIQGLIGVNIIKPLMMGWIIVMLTRHERSPVPGLLKTPHDWLILIYFIYVVWNAPSSQEALKGFFPLITFYALTVQTLTNWGRVIQFLKTWNWMLIGLSAIAVSSLYGLDLTGAVDMTLKNGGRLSIGTWLCNNPNSLAHTIIVAIPVSYCLFFWKGRATGMLIAFPLYSLLAGTCAYYTGSKGAYLVAGGLVVMVFVIGRPLGVKVLALAAAATMGVSALSFLPRMEQMGNLRSDEGVQGRLMAWELARTARDKTTTGEGWMQFSAMINWEGETIPKATHSSYVQVGADLGLPGLFLFVAGLWCAMHSLISAHRLTSDDEVSERCRRTAMILVIAYAVSSWMINRQYHTEYFLTIAIAAAIHRLCQAEANQEDVSDLEAAGESEVEGEFPTISQSTQILNGRSLPRLVIQDNDEESESKSFWTKIGFLDLLACSALTWCVVEIWDYVLTSF
jgi:hypothetical protein